MLKTKLGISVGLVGAAVYFSALFSGYIPVILITGYVLLAEENEWLKRTCVKAVVLLMSISVLLTTIGLIPDVLSWIGAVVSVFKGYFNYAVVSSILSVFTKAIEIIRTVLFLLLGIKAFNQSTIAIPFVDKLVSKYF